MDLTRKFEKMKDDCARLQVSLTVREHLKGRLDYFRIQSLCDTDRRDDQRKITEAWNEFVTFAKPTGIIRHFMNDPNVWNEVAAIDKTHDVVLMDIQMPEMDGYQALAKLRADGFKTPIVALTAHALNEERMKTRAAGFASHLTKPIDKAALIETLNLYWRL